jgi:hypothetical protein
MKPRARRAHTLLALAMTASAGCVTRSETPPDPSMQPPAPEKPVVERSFSNDPALLALADDLRGEGRERALGEQARFRPLCDSDGYPLVGNVMRKGPGPEADYQPSRFCADTRGRR